ncbi:putative HxlR family transcriptional regulator [Streptomyces sp. NBRC 110611]|uniref:winged helix-turn-helix transcriptional regulator n=1 Tax=Streptomyces sp. NBRC 110611 TaxID=1621259 RepID=UPI00082D7D71|nr:helix-turn-helix domain-containing protein [Streptomyces sp. NBRC 110611]GAU69067.1 putative HxlR family transcriptional regulator [Streptomyces sp. NBRC 110611]
MPRRSYDQYCAVARALDAIGDRWTLLIVRELLGGSRRYTDLHADLPGVSTDMLASRLKGMERDGLVTRRRLAPPGAASVYELTDRGRSLLPALTALADWGAPALDEKCPTDAVRAHWFAVPLLARLTRHFADDGVGVVDIALDEGEFHVVLGGDGPGYADGPAEHPDIRLRMDTATCADLAHDRLSLAEGIASGRIEAGGSPATGPRGDAG